MLKKKKEKETEKTHGDSGMVFIVNLIQEFFLNRPCIIKDAFRTLKDETTKSVIL